MNSGIDGLPQGYMEEDASLFLYVAFFVPEYVFVGILFGIFVSV